MPTSGTRAGDHLRHNTPRRAAFLAHLIATARQMPQTREKRRAEAGEAIAAYAEMQARLHTYGDGDQ